MSKSKIDDADLSILQRISEDDVEKWLLAKMRQYRQAGLPVDSMTANVMEFQSRGEPRVCRDFSVQTSMECASRPSADAAAVALLKAERAAGSRGKRERAEQLLKEAETAGTLVSVEQFIAQL